MKRVDIIRYLILRTVGNFLVLFALFGVGATFGPTLYYEIVFHIQQAQGMQYVVADPPTISHPDNPAQSDQLCSLVHANKDNILIPKDTFFDVLIPKIGANARVFPNVDSTNEDEYLKVLQKGVAHAKGSVFPGIPGTTYLFAHSTDSFIDVGRYNAVFYLLKDLNPGDQVVIFYQNKRYNYTVAQTKITDGNDVSYLTHAHEGPEQLVLQTCWPPGTAWKRLLVIAKPVGK